MTEYAYRLELPSPQCATRSLTKAWLYLAVGSLMMGGVLPLLIVAARVPGLYEHVPLGDFFRTAIVIHVDLTVLSWFLAFAGVLWSLACKAGLPKLGWTALVLVALGTVTFAFSPFLGAVAPIMNNYIPVLQNRVFLVGLSLLAFGFCLLIIRSLLLHNGLTPFNSPRCSLRMGLFTALLAACIALLSIVAAYVLIPDEITGQAYYELLFWGGGHALQFTHTQLMLVVWLWLASASGALPRLQPRLITVILVIGFLPVLALPSIFLSDEIVSAAFRLAVTQMMVYGNGLAAIPIGGVIIWSLIRAGAMVDEQKPQRYALVLSLLLFAVGGVIGILVRDINVTIPAHYHGSIVGVVLAYMGMTYYLLPHLGFAKPPIKLAKMQPIIYGVGQLIHIFGLAWSGQYGVQRKTAGAEQALDSVHAQLGMKLAGAGTVIALLGGLLFAVVVIIAIVKRSK